MARKRRSIAFWNGCVLVPIFLSLGADVRAGVGFETGASANLDKDGMVSVGGNMSGSAGVGTGIAEKFGVNPVALGQLVMLKSMECVNKGYDALEKIPKAVCKNTAKAAAVVGAQLEAQSEKGGILGGASDALLHVDRKVRGLDKDTQVE